MGMASEEYRHVPCTTCTIRKESSGHAKSYRGTSAPCLPTISSSDYHTLEHMSLTSISTGMVSSQRLITELSASVVAHAPLIVYFDFQEHLHFSASAT